MKQAQLLSLDIQPVLKNIVHCDRWYSNYTIKLERTCLPENLHRVLREASCVQRDDATQLISLNRHKMIDNIMHSYSCHAKSKYAIGVEQRLIHTPVWFKQEQA